MEQELDMVNHQTFNKLTALQKDLINELVYAMSFDPSSSPFRVINDAMELYWPSSKRGKEMDKSTIKDALKQYNKIRALTDRA